ncbi:MAG: hypothetical protein J2P17_28135 [Mycobacterium sp.]|nr:hypothetical protein [Mycobacterium sp.]
MRIGIGGSMFGLRAGISNKGFGFGAGPISVGAGWPRARRRRRSVRRASNRHDDAVLGMLVVAVVLIAVAPAVIGWPYLLGTWIAVQAGAHNPSAARDVVGWILETPYLAAMFALVVLYYRASNRQRSDEIRAALQAAYPNQPYLWMPQAPRNTTGVESVTPVPLVQPPPASGADYPYWGQQYPPRGPY